jgi:hypothetical protein
MPRKPLDPLLSRVLTEPAQAVADPHWEACVLAGLPDCAHWRRLGPDEPLRTGDYWWDVPGNRWVAQQEPGPGRDLAFRPLGDDCLLWYIGRSQVSPQYRTGAPDLPFATLEEALAQLPGERPCLIFHLGEQWPCYWRDPAAWDWSRYLETVAREAQTPPEPELTDAHRSLTHASVATYNPQLDQVREA